MNKEKLIKFEEEIAELFNSKKIKAPVHLYHGNEDHIIRVFKKIKTNMDCIVCLDHTDTIKCTRCSCLICESCYRALLKKDCPLCGIRSEDFIPILYSEWNCLNILELIYYILLQVYLVYKGTRDLIYPLH